MTDFEDTEEVIEGPLTKAQATPPGGRTEAHSAAAEDPWQLLSAHAPPENAERLAQLSGTLSVLEDCEGAGCRNADGDP
jgi:hypothetical protein